MELREGGIGQWRNPGGGGGGGGCIGSMHVHPPLGPEGP